MASEDMSEEYIRQLVGKLFTNYYDLTPTELAILSQVPAETPPPGVQSNFADLATMEKPMITVISILLTLVTVCMAIRAHVKIGITKKLTWDDGKQHRFRSCIAQAIDCSKRP